MQCEVSAAQSMQCDQEAELWLQHFTELLQQNMLPQMAAVERAWRAASGHRETIRFRATVKRTGVASKYVGTSELAAG